MYSRFQITRSALGVSASASALRASLFALIFACAFPVRAQQPPPGAVGEVQGSDITVDGGTAALAATATSAPKMFVSNGSVLTVHSGQAVMTLFAGGEVDICGPAKITILRSADAITLALNFGRMRVELPPKTSLRVFTPSVIGTPLDISGGARDVTMGLNLDDSMCVLATSGAIELANQFTDQTLIVPQSGEFFLTAGKLQPVAGTPGSCACTARTPPPPPAAPAEIPQFAEAAPAGAARDATIAVPVAGPTNTAPAYVEAKPATPSRHSADVAPPAAPPAIPARPMAEAMPAPKLTQPMPPPVDYGVSAAAGQVHPVVPAATSREAAATNLPVAPSPTPPSVTPALMFSASSPGPPGDPTPDMVFLIRTARVEPEWVFTGTVAAPEFVTAMQKSLAVEPPAQPPVADRTAAKKKGGFWSALKRLFGGGD